jgi:dolichol-phosphate mannosyltransferase
VLVVDDDSPDGTGRVADELAARHAGRVDVLHRDGPRGLGHAYVAGIRRALEGDAELICQMDADLSHDPQYLPSMVAATAAHDLVIGSRYLNGVSVVNWPLRRLALSTAANRYIRFVTGLPVKDCTSGYRCWRREALERVHLESVRSQGYAFLVETLHAAWLGGSRVTEVPIIFVERRKGSSKLSSGTLLESVLIPWRLRLRSLRRGGRRLT